MKIDMTSLFSAKGGGPIWIKCRRLVQNDMSAAVMWWQWKPEVEFQYGGRLGEFNGNVIPEPPATLQGAATWRNQYHDRATLQGVRIPSAIVKIVFRHIYFFVFIARQHTDAR